MEARLEQLEEAVGFPLSTYVNSANERRCFPGWLRRALMISTFNCRQCAHTPPPPVLFSFHQPASPTVFRLVVWLLVEESAHTLLFLGRSRKYYVGSCTVLVIHGTDSNMEIVLGPLLWPPDYIFLCPCRALKESQVDKFLLISQCMNNVIFLLTISARYIFLPGGKSHGWEGSIHDGNEEAEVKWRLFSRAALKTNTYCNSCWVLVFPTGLNCLPLQLSLQSEAVFIIVSLSLREFMFLLGE